MRGLGCEAIAVLWIAILSWRTSRTYGMCRSECRVWFVTYRGAFVRSAGKEIFFHVIRTMVLKPTF
jgi:hypothetical protein